MHSETFKHKNQEYKITVHDMNVGGMAGPHTWVVRVNGRHNQEIVNATIGGTLATYIESTYGMNHIEFLVGFAKSEIQKLAS